MSTNGGTVSDNPKGEGTDAGPGGPSPTLNTLARLFAFAPIELLHPLVVLLHVQALHQLHLLLVGEHVPVDEGTADACEKTKCVSGRMCDR